MPLFSFPHRDGAGYASLGTGPRPMTDCGSRGVTEWMTLIRNVYAKSRHPFVSLIIDNRGFLTDRSQQ